MKGYAVYESVESDGSNDLVIRYAPLVKRIADHLASRLPSNVQFDDLTQAGMIGLLEAVRQYDAAQGASFQTYAGIRVRGAMLDEIRRLDWTPRSVHRRAREVAGAIRAIENRTGGEPRDREVAAYLGMPLEDYHRILLDASTARLFSLDEADPVTGEPREPAGDERQPEETLANEDFRRDLAGVIRGLPEREQLIMQLYYDEELNLREIGAVLGVSESRISQIHGRIMLKLRAGLADWIDG